MARKLAAKAFFLGTIFIFGALGADPIFAAQRKVAPKAAQAPKNEEQDFDQFESEADQSKAAKPVFDPLGRYNRLMFNVNDKFYFWLGKPLTKGYSFIVPQPARVAAARGFTNIGFPVRFVSSVFQGKFKGAGSELARFTVNSTIGLAGLFDPADKWLGLKPSDEDLGQLLGYYDVGYGFPLVLPILGQSSLRDGISLLPNFLLNPVYYAADYQTYTAVAAGDKFNYLSLHGEDYEKIKNEALDPYTFIRDAHKQNREKKIKE